MDSVPQLVQIVKVILPFLVKHLQHEVGKQLLGEILGAVALLDLLPRFDLGAECLATGLFDRAHQHFDVGDFFGVFYRRYRYQELHQELGDDQFAVPRLGRFCRNTVYVLLESGLYHAEHLCLELLATFERKQP